MKEKIVIRPILPANRNFIADADKILKETLKATMLGPVAKMLTKAEEGFIEDWEHKPNIATEFEEQKTQYKLTVLPKGIHKRYWVFVSFGIDPHPIQSKSGSGSLFIKGGYSAKTQVGGGKGTGNYAGPFYWWPKVVDNWPGIKPRYFEKEIKKDKEKEIVALMLVAWNRAVAKAGK